VSDADRNETKLVDKELMAARLPLEEWEEQIIPQTPHPTRRRYAEKTKWVPKFPAFVYVEVVKAEAYRAYPLLTAAWRRSYIRREISVRITMHLWRELGSPDIQKRRLVLADLRLLPHLVSLEKDQTPFSYYRLTFKPIWWEPPVWRSVDDLEDESS
jgi:hypothetical protein